MNVALGGESSPENGGYSLLETIYPWGAPSGGGKMAIFSPSPLDTMVGKK